jgi:hypothetical protein
MIQIEIIMSYCDSEIEKVPKIAVVTRGYNARIGKVFAILITNEVTYLRISKAGKKKKNEQLVPNIKKAHSNLYSMPFPTSLLPSL